MPAHFYGRHSIDMFVCGMFLNLFAMNANFIQLFILYLVLFKDNVLRTHFYTFLLSGFSRHYFEGLLQCGVSETYWLPSAETLVLHFLHTHHCQ